MDDDKNAVLSRRQLKVGYFDTIVPAIIENYPEIIVELLKSESGEKLFHAAQSEDDLESVGLFVERVVKQLSYVDFSRIESYFFSYVELEEELVAYPIHITRGELMEYQRGKVKEISISHHFSLLPENEEERPMETVVAVNPIEGLTAVLMAPGVTMVEPYLNELGGLISDYRRSETTEQLIVSYLEANTSSEFQTSVKLAVPEGGDWKDYLCDQLELYPGLTINWINRLLDQDDQLLIVHTTYDGYSDVMELYYLMDQSLRPYETVGHVHHYLEHVVGAYYRGDLTELVIYDSEGDILESYLADYALFNGPIETQVRLVKEYTWDDAYMDYESVEYLEELGVVLDEVEVSQWIDLTAAEKEELLVPHLKVGTKKI